MTPVRIVVAGGGVGAGVGSRRFQEGSAVGGRFHQVQAERYADSSARRRVLFGASAAAARAARFRHACARAGIGRLHHVPSMRVRVKALVRPGRRGASRLLVGTRACEPTRDIVGRQVEEAGCPDLHAGKSRIGIVAALDNSEGHMTGEAGVVKPAVEWVRRRGAGDDLPAEAPDRLPQVQTLPGAQTEMIHVRRARVRARERRRLLERARPSHGCELSHGQDRAISRNEDDDVAVTDGCRLLAPRRQFTQSRLCHICSILMIIGTENSCPRQRRGLGSALLWCGPGKIVVPAFRQGFTGTARRPRRQVRQAAAPGRGDGTAPAGCCARKRRSRLGWARGGASAPAVGRR